MEEKIEVGENPLANAAGKMAIFQVVQKRWYNNFGLPLKTQNFEHDEGSVPERLGLQQRPPWLDQKPLEPWRRSGG